MDLIGLPSHRGGGGGGGSGGVEMSGAMEAAERRRRTTLSEHLAAAVSEIANTPSSSAANLRDLLNDRQEEDCLRQHQEASCPLGAGISLGSFLAGEKRERSSPGLAVVASAARGRTLLDVIRGEDGESLGAGRVYTGDIQNRRSFSWRRAFKKRLRLCRSGSSAVRTPRNSSDENVAGPTGVRPSTLAPPSGGGQQTGETRRGSSAAAVQGREAARQEQVRPSLMALLGETGSHVGRSSFAAAALLEGAASEEEEESGGKREAAKCCVCMVRKKGAAFIPCGHTFCRLCSREVWVNRGSCPLCNGFILEILDIF